MHYYKTSRFLSVLILDILQAYNLRPNTKTQLTNTKQVSTSFERFFTRKELIVFNLICIKQTVAIYNISFPKLFDFLNLFSTLIPSF